MRRIVVAAVLAALLFVPAAGAWTWPGDGAVLQTFLFDPAHPYAAGQHRGIAIAGDPGSPVRAPAAGTVTFAGSVPGSGMTVTIATADGYAVTLTHLGSIGVAEGATVAEGDSVGTVAGNGDADISQPYFHLGIRVAANAQGYVDPLSLLPVRSGTAAAPTAAPAPPPSPEPAAAPPASAAPTAAPSAAPPAVSPAAGPAPAAPAPPDAEPVPAAAPVASAPPPASDPAPFIVLAAAPRTTAPVPAVHEAMHPAAGVARPAVVRIARSATTPPPRAVPEPTDAGRRQAPMVARAPQHRDTQRGTRHGIRPLPVRRQATRPVAWKASHPAVPPHAHRVLAPSTLAPTHPGHRLPLGVVASAALLALVASVVALGVRLRAVRMIGRRDEFGEEDPRGAGLAVCGGIPAPRARGGLRRPGGRLRPLPPVERQRRADGQRHGRARHAGDGRRRQGREVLR